jgi:NAD(P)-dependent dehydrogenase (short-subunit alcohol dehydrogenase family)
VILALRAAGVCVVEAPAFDALSVNAVSDIDGIVDLNLDESSALSDRSAWKHAVSQSLCAFKAVYEAWSTEADAQRLSYLAVTRFGGQMGYLAPSGSNPLCGIWAGLAKSLPREMPNLKVRVLDLGPASVTDGERVVAELESNDGLIEVGWSGSERYTLASVREAASPRTLQLHEHDQVLISGGARGIGFALALALAERFECQVTVTGRSNLDGPASAIEELSPLEFSAYRNQRLSRRAAGESIRQIRNELARVERLRELRRNLAHARARGLRIRYEQCDFTSASAVSRMLETVGPVSVLVHNAGVDTPMRLGTKSVATCLETLSVKLDGFLNLFELSPRANLKAICCVGSLTGRLGGMVGQIDYGAANEGLTRLATHLAAEVQVPLKTLCFPTWERLGMVSNFEATLQYMAPLAVGDGVEHWLNDLLSTGTGEVTFMGEVGPALSPLQLGGYPAVSDLPGVERLRAMSFYVGQTLAFVPGQLYRACVRLRRQASPCFQEFAIDGQSSLPVSCLLEVALASARWLVPPLTGQFAQFSNVRIFLPALALTGDEVEIAVDARRNGQAVAVEIRDQRSDTVIAELTYAGAPGPGALAAASFENSTRTGGGVPRWRQFLWPACAWSAREQRIEAVVHEMDRNDVWLSPLAPEPELPLAAIEALLQALITGAGSHARVSTLECSAFAARRPRASRELLSFDPPARNATVKCLETGETIFDAQSIRVAFE